jgi:hypothetical protein
MNDTSFLIGWARDSNTFVGNTARTQRYLDAIRAMNTDQLAFFLAVAVIVGKIELPSFPDED